MSHSDPIVTNGKANGLPRRNDMFTGKNPLQFTTQPSRAKPQEKRQKTKAEPSHPHNPFDDSFLNHVINLLKTHGIAASKIIFMLGTAAATLYAGLSFDSWTVRFMVWGCGFLLECCFAYAWVMTGSERLAGEQLILIRRIFKASSLVMLGDLATMLLAHQAGVHELFITWTSGVQPTAGVYLMWLLYRLKESHPETIARQQVDDLKARERAMDLLDAAEEQRLRLAEREHERALKWAALKSRHAHGIRLVTSRWYDRQIKRATKEAVGQRVEGAAAKMKRLPQLLSIGGEAKQTPKAAPSKKAKRGWFRRK